jgi:hypothetical protein
VETTAADGPSSPDDNQPIHAREATGGAFPPDNHTYHSDKDEHPDNSEAEGTNVHCLPVGHIASANKQRKRSPFSRKCEQSYRSRQNEDYRCFTHVLASFARRFFV